MDGRPTNQSASDGTTPGRGPAAGSLNIDPFLSAVGTVVRVRGLDLTQVKTLGNVRGRLRSAPNPTCVVAVCFHVIESLHNVRNVHNGSCGLTDGEMLALWRATAQAAGVTLATEGPVMLELVWMLPAQLRATLVVKHPGWESLAKAVRSADAAESVGGAA